MLPRLVCPQWFRTRRLAAAFALGGLACVSALAQPQAPSVQQPAAGATATIQTERNVYRAGGQVRPPGPVAGDFTAVGGRVIVDQPVSGDAAVAGGAVDVRAAVGDDVRAAGGDVNIEGSVGGELFASGGNVIVTRAASIAKGARLYGADITMEGQIQGPLRAAGQKIVINGEVRGDVRLMGEQLELGPMAKIEGALSYASRTELKKAEGAVVTGAITREERGPAERERPEAAAARGAAWGGTVFMFLVTLLSAAVLMALAPSLAANTADWIRTSPWASLGLGLLVTVVVPVIAMLLFITILGIPLALLVMALYPALWLLGFLIAAVFIARLIPALMKKPAPAGYGATMGYVAIALLLILMLARVPVLGGLVAMLLTLAGTGACVLAVYRRKHPRPSEPETPLPLS